ncbi:MAG: heme biosynthesis HemY N-terminal domain-containing protein [Inhella sp.]
MRGVIWLTLLFAAAVVAALTLGRNDGLVSLFWDGWRVDLSLNFFLLLLLGACLLVFGSLHALQRLFSLPERARAWRLQQRDRGAQLMLREALSHLWGGRYARAQKSVQKLLQLQSRTPELRRDAGALTLAHLLAAEAAHKLQDRRQRQEQFEAALRQNAPREQLDAARLQAVVWALDDRDAPRAMALLAELPPGTARRTQALRLRLQAARLAAQPLEALRTTRLLAKHQGFAPDAAQSLVRALAFELLDGARDADQLRQAWLQLENAERRDPFIAARAAERLAQWGDAAEARQWLRPFWDDIARLGEEEREALALALLAALPGLSADWLPRLEAAQLALPRDPLMPLVMGHALAELQLWGKAQQLLGSSAADARVPAMWRRRSWLSLAELAQQAGDNGARIQALEEAARLP